MTPRRSVGSPAFEVAAWVSLFALGAFERLRTWGAVFTPDGVFLAPTDSYYYARLAKLSAAAFPRPVLFDTQVAFPGMEVPWPPGHAWLLSAALRLFGAEPFSARGLTVLAWVGPVLGVAIGALVAVLARRLWGWKPAFVCAAAVWLTPAALTTTELGEADHHGYEVLLGVLLPLCLLAGIGSRRWRRWAAFGGTALGLAHLTCTAAFTFSVPLAVAVAAASVLPGRRRARAARVALAMLATAVPLVAAGAAWLGRLGKSDSVRLSGFQLLVLLCSALLVGSALVGRAFVSSRHRGRWLVALRVDLAVTAALAVALLAVLALGQGSALGDALRQLVGQSQILGAADESLPLRSFELGLFFLGALVVVAPLVLWQLGLAARRGVPQSALLLVWSLEWLVLALVQGRFSRPLAGTVGVALGLLVFEALKSPSASGRQPARGWIFAAAALVLVPTPRLLDRGAGPHPVLALTRSMLDFLRERTPDPGGPSGPYCVLAPWTLGHLIATLGERPALATPFGQVVEAERAARESAAAFAETDPEALFSRIHALGVRYVLAVPFPGGREGLTEAMGRPIPSRPVIDQLRLAPSALGHLALRFVAREQFQGGPLGRVYEVVRGARVQFAGVPGTPYSVALTLRKGDALQAQGTLDEKGGATLVVPYADSELEGPVTVTRGELVLHFAPSAQAVAVGEDVPAIPP